MCGIAGIIGKPHQETEKVVNSMLDTMTYRGPNDRGVWGSDDVTLGHLRLSIIDLSSAGHQPMLSHDGRFVLIYNGEVYNYIELREELKQRGAQFQSETDSEVIIEAYRQYGPDCVQQFNGMWAFAIWDTQEKTLFLSRDRFGIKPLFYTFENGELQFASEMKALLTDRSPKANWHYYYHFFDRRTPLGCDQAVFEGILHLRPGHNLLFKDGQMSITRYWRPDHKRAQQDYDYSNTKATLRELTDSSIALRLRSDVPVGICLSGGVDSSVIAVSLASQGVNPQTFSSVFEDERYNEKNFIELVNAAVQAEPHMLTPRSEDFFSVMEKIVHHHDEPVRMPGTYSHWHVMQCAHGHVTVLLDGQGGDEVFGGYTTLYPSYLASLMTDMLMLRSPGDAWSKMHACLDGIAEHFGSSKPYLYEAFARMLPGSIRSALGKKRVRDDLFSKNFIDAYSSPLSVDGEEQQLINRLPSRLSRDMYEMFSETNMPMLLRYEDRNSMAFSLEARVPLLDYRLVEFALGLNYREKMHGYDTKWLLREAYKDLLPAEVYGRKDKKGFPTPAGEWFRGDLRDEITHRLSNGAFLDAGLCEKSTVLRLLEEHQSGKNHERALFRLLTLDMWMKEHNL